MDWDREIVSISNLVCGLLIQLITNSWKYFHRLNMSLRQWSLFDDVRGVSVVGLSEIKDSRAILANLKVVRDESEKVKDRRYKYSMVSCTSPSLNVL